MDNDIEDEEPTETLMVNAVSYTHLRARETKAKVGWRLVRGKK